MAVGALEPKFFSELVRLRGVEVDPAAQHDRAGWPAMREAFVAAFATRTRDEWTAVFDGTDACVAPVLALPEAASRPHLAARGSVTDAGGLLQPGLAPRFSGHPDAVPGEAPRRGADTRAVLEAAGVDAGPLLDSGAAAQA